MSKTNIITIGYNCEATHEPWIHISCRIGSVMRCHDEDRFRSCHFFVLLFELTPCFTMMMMRLAMPLQHTQISRFLQGRGRRALSAAPILPKVLVANRGEIACRVLRTCRRLRIPTVAIYSVTDGPYALHAQMADEAYLIGSGPSPRESYLLKDQVLDIAMQANVAAIHPVREFVFCIPVVLYCSMFTDSVLV